jgi:hypothetical protein
MFVLSITVKMSARQEDVSRDEMMSPVQGGRGNIQSDYLMDPAHYCVFKARVVACTSVIACNPQSRKRDPSDQRRISVAFSG